MRKGWMGILLLGPLLLSGCGGKDQAAQRQGVLLRGQYQAMTGWQGTFQVCASLGEQVYEFTLQSQGQAEKETVVTVVEPDWMAGVTAHLSAQEQTVEYEGAGMTLGTLNHGGLSPISAIPTLVDEATQGYIAQCSWQQEGEETLLELLCRNPEEGAQEGTEYVMWFDPDTFALRWGEVRVKGTTVLTVKCDDFTMEMNEDEPTDHEDLGGDPSGQPGA